MNHRPTVPPIPSHPLRWLPEFWALGRRRLRGQARLLALSLAVGVIAGLGAVVFFAACQLVAHHALEGVAGYQPHSHPLGEPELFRREDRPLNPWLLLGVLAVGGLASGVLVFTLAPEAEGHGTDAAIAAYHHGQGLIRPRVPLVKIISSALTLGTGGSGGREGPIAQIGAGFGSFLGGLLRLRPAERRVLMAAGMGAGVAAIFRAPLAGALFAAEILYRSPDFESEVIIPAALASITAYCTFGAVFGWQPLFIIPQEVLARLTFGHPLELVSYLALTVVVIVLAMLYTRSFYGLTHLFHRLPMPRHFKPALGALLTGLLGLGLYYLLGRDDRVLAVLATGYGILQEGVTITPGSTPDLELAAVLLAVALGKIATTGLTIGSGGSGGVFGPSMVIGGCGGGALGLFLKWLAGDHAANLVPHPASFVIVGMAGFFAAAAKTPFSTLVIVSEMTGNYNLLLPTLWVCTLAFLLSDEQSIYSSQVQSRSLSPAHQGDYVREVLAGMSVRQLLTPQEALPSLKPAERLPSILERLSATSYHALPVLDPEGRLLGIVSLEEIYLATQLPHLQSILVVADMMRTDVTPLQLDDSIDRALELFVESNLMALPVVRAEDRRVVGIVRRLDVSGTYLRHVQGRSPASVADTAASPP